MPARRLLAEPAVALTDIALAVESAWFAVLVVRGRAGRAALRAPLAMFLTAATAAAAAGALVHGPFPDPRERRHRLLWRVVMAGAVVAAFAEWWMAVRLVLRPAAARAVLAPVGLYHLPFVVRALTGERPFRDALAVYVPGLGALAAAFATRLRVPGERRAAARALAGLGVGIVAAGVQVRRIGLHPNVFDHNALYHVLQVAAIALFVPAARRLGAPVERAARPPVP